MDTVANAHQTREIRFAAWLAIASGLAGLLSFSCLMTYLLTPSFRMDDSGRMSHAARLLMNTNFLAATLQAVFMLPVVRRLSGKSGQRSPQLSRIASLLGITGFSVVALLRVLPIFNPAVSDILFMAPTGLIGMWLLIVTWRSKGTQSRAAVILGMVAAVFLFGVGVNFSLMAASRSSHEDLWLTVAMFHSTSAWVSPVRQLSLSFLCGPSSSAFGS